VLGGEKNLFEGKVLHITKKELQAEYLKAQACKLCLPHIMDSAREQGSEAETISAILKNGGDAEVLSHIAAEVNEADVAFKVALFNDKSPAYALAAHFFRLKENEGEWTRNMNDELYSYIRQLKPAHLSDLAQCFIAYRVKPLPHCLKQQLIDTMQV
jgi:hypothetical protein